MRLTAPIAKEQYFTKQLVELMSLSIVYSIGVAGSLRSSSLE